MLAGMQRGTSRFVTVVGAVVVGANILFWLLSSLYFASKVTYSSAGEVPAFTSGEQLDVRMAFLVLSVIVAVASIGAATKPNEVGHAIMAVMAPASLAAGLGAAVYGLPGVLAATELVLGTILVVVVPMSWRGSRAAWSFLIAIAGVYAVVLFFGAPKVRGVLHIGLWTTLILPGLNAVALTALVRSRARYRS